MASNITPEAFFKKFALKVVKTEQGLLAYKDWEDQPLTTEAWSKIRHIPTCDAPYAGALMTCFARDEQELMGFITTAAGVANYIHAVHDAAGCI